MKLFMCLLLLLIGVGIAITGDVFAYHHIINQSTYNSYNTSGALCALVGFVGFVLEYFKLWDDE